MADKVEEKILNRRSWVRVLTTYSAGFFLFVFGPVLILTLIIKGRHDDALNLFNTVLPVAAAVVSFWFAGRGGANQQRETE